MVAIRESLVAVCDAGPLIHLDEFGCLDLLGDFIRVEIPVTVSAEVSRFRRIDFSRHDFLVVPDPAPSSEMQLLSKAFSIHDGESSAIACARRYPNALLLTDDSSARAAATGIGLRVHGTIGLLLRGVRTGRRSAAQIIDILERLPQISTLYIKSSILQSAMDQLRARPQA